MSTGDSMREPSDPAAGPNPGPKSEPPRPVAARSEVRSRLVTPVFICLTLLLAFFFLKRPAGEVPNEVLSEEEIRTLRAKGETQRLAVAKVEAAGLSVVYEFPSNPDRHPPKWKIDLVGRDALFAVYSLPWQRSKVTDAEMVLVKEFPHVTHVFLTGTQVGDEGLKHLASLPNLERLELSATKVTDAGLKYLERARNLSYLDLIGTAVTDAGMEHLQTLPRLAELDLSATQITDASTAILKRFPALFHLRADETALTDRSFAHLAGMKGLRRLDLSGTQTTLAAREAFARKNPQIEFFRPEKLFETMTPARIVDDPRQGIFPDPAPADMAAWHRLRLPADGFEIAFPFPPLRREKPGERLVNYDVTCTGDRVGFHVGIERAWSEGSPVKQFERKLANLRASDAAEVEMVEYDGPADLEATYRLKALGRNWMRYRERLYDRPPIAIRIAMMVEDGTAGDQGAERFFASLKLFDPN